MSRSRNTVEERAYQRDRRARLRAAGLCSACGQCPPVEGGSWCGDCRAKGRQQNASRREATNRQKRELRDRRRAAVVAAYGGQCGCCGETDPRFLTIDHIDGGGTAHRLEHKNDIYRWLVKHDFPAGFRLLCFNCNCGRERNGGVCPHEEERAEVLPLRAVG